MLRPPSRLECAFISRGRCHTSPQVPKYGSLATSSLPALTAGIFIITHRLSNNHRHDRVPVISTVTFIPRDVSLTKSRYLEGTEVSRQIFKYSSFLKSNIAKMYCPKYIFSSKTVLSAFLSILLLFSITLSLRRRLQRDMRTLKRVIVVTCFYFFHGCLGPLDCRITGLVFGDFFAYSFFRAMPVLLSRCIKPLSHFCVYYVLVSSL